MSKSTYDKMFEQNEANEKFHWAADQPYIHYHRENAQRAAGGLSLAAIQANALASAKVAAIERFNQTIYNGKSNAEDLAKFDNAIGDINNAIADSNQIVALLDEIVNKTVDFAGDGSNISAHEVASKISVLIGGVRGSSYAVTSERLDEILTLLYDKDLHSLIKSLKSQKKNLTAIKQQQLESLIHLEEVMKTSKNNWNDSAKTSARNALVDILTEQGLPDFIARCLEQCGYEADKVIMDALQFGKVRVAEGHQKGSQGKIDTQMTFMTPEGRKITQGISLKSNWGGHFASILTTSIKSTLTYANQGNQYAMVNAVSLMDDVKQLNAWMEWSNLDRALQGTMAALKNGLQDRADMLIEFTSRGLQVFNINYMLWKLLQVIKSMRDVPLTDMGFGMTQKYGLGMKVYDRSKFTSENIATAIANRSNYTAKWLSDTHAVALNAEAMINFFMTH